MGLEEKLPSGVLLTSVEKVVNWSRKSSLWPATFGLACCAIEMMAAGGGRYDMARFGMEVFRPSPRQADLMIVAGRVSQKMAPVLRQIYDQMPEPKWVIAMGVCASSGGMFNNYAIVQGVDHVVPVDMYLPGCPPRPEMLIDAILKLHDKIMDEPLGRQRPPPRAARLPAARAGGEQPALHQGGQEGPPGGDAQGAHAMSTPSEDAPKAVVDPRAAGRSTSLRAGPDAVVRHPGCDRRARVLRHVRGDVRRRHLRLRRPGRAVARRWAPAPGRTAAGSTRPATRSRRPTPASPTT